ncbi:F-box/FBD/LRR-repeat protein At4g26340-like [Ziziphus jujuba]|uniref:F-box/FBD/LRR-repeat protein At4g26340-like n=1 Tax=Ziziphus jujuba TaxID=326968 RepID=A0ABM3ZTV3_ZIZJJ|nr:F-box/FBD/LRR-repeat protein At4g26340-like [Ziziphus jujuba]
MMKANLLHGRRSRVRNNKKKKKKDKQFNNEDDDRISELPEDIMVRIVSLLPLKEAAATSILSKRWRNIWTFTTNLDFHDEQTVNYLFNLPREDYHTLINHARLKYIDGVNRVITKLSSKTNNTLVGGLINRFRINFDLCRSFSYSIDNWIEFAMKNRVQVLELLFYRYGGLARMPDSLYTLGKNHFDPKTLKSLRVLNLASVDISGEVLEWLLSNCPLLERLQVAGSDGNLVNLRILGVPLKHLEIRGCCIRKLEILDAQNLVSLHIQTTYCFRTFVLKNVPKLVDLFFDINFSLDGEHLGRNFSLLSSCLSQLQILHLDLSIYKHLRNVVYPVLSNLKQLKLIFGATKNLTSLLSVIISFLNASPRLQRLELMMLSQKYYDQMRRFKIEPTNCPLKEVEILGYSGSPTHDQLIMYLAENLVALQKIIVHPSEFDINQVFKLNKDDKTIREEEKVRDHAMQHIKQEIPTTIEFVCL